MTRLLISSAIFPLLGVSAVLAAFVLTVWGGSQPDTFAIGIVNITPAGQPLLDGFKAGMVEQGYVDGDNVTYIYEGPVSIEGLDDAIQNLVEANIDLILAITTPAALQAKQATEGADIPVVFVPSYDPVKSGLVESLINPGGNLTGVRGGGLIPKQMELFLDVAHETKRLFSLYNPDDVGAIQSLADLEEVAAKFDLELVVSEARTAQEVGQALDTIPEDVDAYFHLPSGLLLTHFTRIAQTSIEHKLPLTSVGSGTQEGGLMSYGPDDFQMGEQASRLAAKVLNGTDPADLPVETADFFLGINLRTADAIGIDIPDHILEQADDIVR